MTGFESKVNIDFAQDTDNMIQVSRESHLLSVGWSKHEIEERICSEIKMTREADFVKEFKNNHDIKNNLVLDVGCSIGGFVVQFGLNGAEVIGIEPSREYSIITQKRIAKYDLKNKCQCITAPGELLPFPDNTFDYVIILSVL